MHLVYPQTFLYNHRFQFLLGIAVVSREVEDNGSETFGGGGGGGGGEVRSIMVLGKMGKKKYHE